MNLTLTDDQRMIRDSAAEFLGDACDSAAVRKAKGFDADLWKRVAELGWCGSTIPESFGGLGMGPVELVLLAEQMGRFLAPVPFLSTVCHAGTLVAESGSAKAKKEWLPKIASGSLIAACHLEAAPTSFVRIAGSKLNGRARIADAAEAQLLLFVTGNHVFAVPGDARGLRTQNLSTWDGTRRLAEVTLRNVHGERIDDAKSIRGLPRALSLARLYLAAEQLGSAQQSLDLILRYTAERKQFGRAIASFQAVKHRCAQLMVKVESLRSMVYGAAAVAAGRATSKALAMECNAAKALGSETAFDAAAEAIQLHGGVGFTTEFDPQLYFKRAQADSHRLGAANALHESIAQALLG